MTGMGLAYKLIGTLKFIGSVSALASMASALSASAQKLATPHVSSHRIVVTRNGICDLVAEIRLAQHVTPSLREMCHLDRARLVGGFMGCGAPSRNTNAGAKRKNMFITTVIITCMMVHGFET